LNVPASFLNFNFISDLYFGARLIRGSHLIGDPPENSKIFAIDLTDEERLG